MNFIILFFLCLFSQMNYLIRITKNLFFVLLDAIAMVILFAVFKITMIKSNFSLNFFSTFATKDLNFFTSRRLTVRNVKNHVQLMTFSTFFVMKNAFLNTLLLPSQMTISFFHFIIPLIFFIRTFFTYDIRFIFMK